MNKKHKFIPKKSNKKLFIILLVALFTLIALFSVIYATNQSSQKNTQQIDTSGDSRDFNLNPPTEEEIAETEEFKKNQETEQSAPNSSTADGYIIVTPVVVSLSEDEVSAYIPGIFEENGTCRATFEKDGQTKEFESTGFGNVSNTTCEPIKTTSLDRGTWKVIVSYESTTSKGNSAESMVTIQ